MTFPWLHSSGLQGSWNAFSEKKGIKVPFGSVIVFSLWYVLDHGFLFVCLSY